MSMNQEPITEEFQFEACNWWCSLPIEVQQKLFDACKEKNIPFTYWDLYKDFLKHTQKVESK